MAHVSVLGAADRALQETRSRLFPARLDLWFTLGFIAFLEQCGKSGPAYLRIPIGDWSGDGEDGGSEDGAGISPLLALMADNVVWVTLFAAFALALSLAVAAVVFWIRSRGTFMYLDGVAGGHPDLGRSWREHADRASSYFAWLFGSTVLFLIGILLLLLPFGWSAFQLVRHGRSTGAVAVLLSSLLAILLWSLLAALLGIALRDFVAPLQWSARLSCGEALRLFLGMAAANPGVFIAYAFGKTVFAFLAGTVVALVGCVTCCCGLMPVIQQTLLQPLFYFDRRWSLELLADLGYAMPAPT
jgi:hypothetical protein